MKLSSVVSVYVRRDVRLGTKPMASDAVGWAARWALHTIYVVFHVISRRSLRRAFLVGVAEFLGRDGPRGNAISAGKLTDCVIAGTRRFDCAPQTRRRHCTARAPATTRRGDFATGCGWVGGRVGHLPNVGVRCNWSAMLESSRSKSVKQRGKYVTDKIILIIFILVTIYRFRGDVRVHRIL